MVSDSLDMLLDLLEVGIEIEVKSEFSERLDDYVFLFDFQFVGMLCLQSSNKLCCPIQALIVQLYYSIRVLKAPV